MEKGSSISDDADESWEWEDVRNIPRGYKFEPEDEDLITYYLKPKLEHKELPPNFMHEIELYRPECPGLGTLTGTMYEGQDEKWYFFTPRDRKYLKGRRPSRASGAGFWKATAACRDVRCSLGNKDVIGHKSSLVFYQGKPPGRKTNWLMQEFYVADHLITKRSCPTQDIPSTSMPDKKIKLDEWVLCKIYKHERNEKKHKNNKASCSLIMQCQYTFPINPSEGLILKENCLTNDDGENGNGDCTNNIRTFVGDNVEGALQSQENSSEKLGDIVQHPKQGGDEMVQEHHGSESDAATAVDDNFWCGSFQPEDIDLSSLDSLLNGMSNERCLMDLKTKNVIVSYAPLEDRWEMFLLGLKDDALEARGLDEHRREDGASEV
ncbi:hypothetical protein Cgig2_002503 [Carnegiea gigantea]|uniref:NAC domain-containing protein n=1 Tax=Carnegiea gigantea TaxID=171969 RepID=A0A9Q1QPW4_9CARY|nr:hypothetical protein Cgig2_002503 [Carnegiea gigantea]